MGYHELVLSRGLKETELKLSKRTLYYICSKEALTIQLLTTAAWHCALFSLPLRVFSRDIRTNRKTKRDCDDSIVRYYNSRAFDTKLIYLFLRIFIYYRYKFIYLLICMLHIHITYMYQQLMLTKSYDYIMIRSLHNSSY